MTKVQLLVIAQLIEEIDNANLGLKTGMNRSVILFGGRISLLVTASYTREFATLRILMKYLLFFTLTLISIHSNAAFVNYTDNSDYNSSVSTDFIWDFEDVPTHQQNHDYVAPDGSTIMPIVLSNLLTPSGPIANLTLHNLVNITFYLNPQLEKAIIFEEAIYSFGIFGLWSDYYTPQGLSVTAFDSIGNPVGTVVSSSQDALVATSNGSINWYESFVGFTSDVAISSVYFDNEIGGAFQYDNLHITYASTIPEPSFLTLLALGLLGAAYTRCSRITWKKLKRCE